MSDTHNADLFLRKALESIAGAESEYADARFNNCANRAYYACFQAAIAALIWEGIRAGGSHWAHTFVQAQFAGTIVNRRHRYPSAMRGTLSELVTLRHSADYDPDPINRAEASRALRRGHEFVEAVRQEGNVRQ
jgi:uncharacterized protein (UPF0332 family)